MTLVIADRVKETSTTTGTGDLSLAGAVSAFRAFSAVCANNDEVMYEIEMGSDWETGRGKWKTGNLLERTTVKASTNANALVNWGVGTKVVRLVASGDKETLKDFLGLAVRQVVSMQTGAVATGTTVIPGDDTIPQITEGNEFMTLAITPTKSTNKLLIEVVIQLSFSLATHGITAALFQDSTANALAAATITCGFVNGTIHQLVLRYVMAAGTVSSTTFRVRGGGDAAGTTTFNGAGGNRFMGGVLASGITITEFVP